MRKNNMGPKVNELTILKTNGPEAKQEKWQNDSNDKLLNSKVVTALKD
jgi:hypothetical protein